MLFSIKIGPSSQYKSTKNDKPSPGIAVSKSLFPSIIRLIGYNGYAGRSF